MARSEQKLISASCAPQTSREYYNEALRAAPQKLPEYTCFSWPAARVEQCIAAAAATKALRVDTH
eukprot:2530-Heterococcus_DN1.PRE.3